jgi:predicted RNase H-like nuclease (RuvC/YqgF family)
MKKLLLLFCILIPFIGSTQTYTENPLNQEIQTLKRELKRSKSGLFEANKKINDLENKLTEISLQLAHSIDSLKIVSLETKEDVNRNFEVQAQNERAVNLALDGFQKKFEDQNKTMEGVKATLEKQWNQQLIIYLILLLLASVAVFFGIKISTKKSIEKYQSTWDNFNEYIVKRNN